jgi:hypothetical protein
VLTSTPIVRFSAGTICYLSSRKGPAYPTEPAQAGVLPIFRQNGNSHHEAQGETIRIGAAAILTVATIAVTGAGSANAETRTWTPSTLPLADDPRPPGVVRLSGRHDMWRVRIDDYRGVYQIVDDRLIVTIIRVAARGAVYRDI